MNVEHFGMLLQEGYRARAYLQKLISVNLLPLFVILLKSSNKKPDTFHDNPHTIPLDFYNPNREEVESLEEANIAYTVMHAESCNDEQVVKELAKRPEEYFVFAGYGILREVFKAGKKLIHVHPGKLPQYRGSTCPYYSILIEGTWYCTALIMEEGIDQGDIITMKEFPLPARGIDATRIYDPYTRAEVLVDVIKQLADTGALKTYKQDLMQGTDYFIIHPVLEYIAKEFCKKSSND
ncbi:MAG: formyltransferase family protein [bacterium]